MQQYKIEGILDRQSEKLIGTAMASVPGVEMVDIDLKRGIVKVEGDVAPDKVMSAVSALGYQLNLI